VESRLGGGQLENVVQTALIMAANKLEIQGIKVMPR
jgi:hypothetical protein